MNETLNQWLEATKNYFARYSPQQKLMMGVVAGLIAAGTLISMAILRHDPQQVLYSDLHSEDSKAIAKKLSDLNIPFQISQDASTISVASSQLYNARMELAKDGLPGQDVVGFERFDGSTLGMSSYVQRIQYIRAVQGEITRSIERLDSVKSARVNISIPPKKTFLEEDEPPKASVILELRPGQAPSKAEVNGVAHLVASAVEGLKISDITIVDTRGNFLFRPEDASDPGVSSALLEMQRSIESDYEKRIEELLTPVVGFGKVRAKVTVEMDPSRVDTTEETYDPDKAVPRQTFKTDETTNGSRPNPIGIPGSRSNLPGTETQNPGVPLATSNTEKHSNNSSYAIPHKVQVTDKPSGTIKRLTVAVVVDGHYTKGATSTSPEVFTPLAPQELKQLEEVIGNAVGYDATRRDSITVTCLQFKDIDIGPTEPVSPNKFDLKSLTQHGIRNGLIGLVILLFFFLVLRPFLKWITIGDTKKIQPEQLPAVLPRTVAELEAVVQSEQLPPPSVETEVLPAADAMAEEKEEELGDTPDKREEGNLKNRILEKLQQSPKKGIRIVQDWLEETEPSPVEG